MSCFDPNAGQNNFCTCISILKGARGIGDPSRLPFLVDIAIGVVAEIRKSLCNHKFWGRKNGRHDPEAVYTFQK